MAGWTEEKRDAFEEQFYLFLQSCYINSKDHGRICLGENLYDGQRYVISEILDALCEDIHDIYILKSRQLGITTIIRALSTFYLGMHHGMKGALVFDTAPNREEARAELVTMIKDLPPRLRFPRIKGAGEGNREGLTLVTDSKILFKSAGVKKSKSSGTLGRSVGLTFCHMSELCSYDNDEGMEAFENSLSDVHPDRLYIRESTARGFNSWWVMWNNAREDPLHRKCIFLGWWSKESQRIDREHPDFRVYGETPPTAKEQEKINIVRERYGHEITSEQLAWIRRRMDPTAIRTGDADPEYEGSNLRIQEQPWIEEDAFQQTGAIFFPAEKLTEITHQHVSQKCKTYMYLAGTEFFNMRIERAPTTRNIDLKVWEEPDPDGVYCMGIDPAFGSNENNDRSCIQVGRCYADGVDQVAEYASPLVDTRQLAWVIASLLGWYGQGHSQIKYALELNGPGTAVFNELRSLRHQIDVGYQAKELQERGLQDVFRNVRTFLYTRADALQGGLNYHIKTTQQLKITFLERLRDYVATGAFRIRSLALVDEMKTIAREGDTIAAPGGMKDDRVMAASFMVHCWELGPRKNLVAQKLTREAVSVRKRLSIVDQAALFQQNMLEEFFKTKRVVRAAQQRLAVQQSWRYR